MSRADDGIVVVGGGLAGLRCAEALRKRGYDGRVRLICGEHEAPYDRPPLSKELSRTPAFLREAGWYPDNDVELVLGRPAKALEPARRTVTLAGEEAIGYEKLLIATGAGARPLPLLSGFENALPLRTVADARALGAILAPGVRLVVVGAGFIGQEVASAARRIGASVTIVEALELPLAGLLGVDVGRRLVRMHREEGVKVILSAQITAAHGDSHVEELELATGERLGCDAVVVGVGVAPAAGWLAGTGLDPSGVLTDPAGRTSIPDVFAAGDVSRPFDEVQGRHVRTEHWEAASRQGTAAAAAMLGDSPQKPPPPSFWSDQHGHRLQYVGHADIADEVRIDGDPDARDFSALYLHRGRPVAGLALDRPREIAAIRRCIADSNRPAPNTKETDR